MILTLLAVLLVVIGVDNCDAFKTVGWRNQKIKYAPLQRQILTKVSNKIIFSDVGDPNYGASDPVCKPRLHMKELRQPLPFSLDDVSKSIPEFSDDMPLPPVQENAFDLHHGTPLNISCAAQFPTGADRDKRFPESSADMQLVFLGTASCAPSPHRGVSCVALKFPKNMCVCVTSSNNRPCLLFTENVCKNFRWLFDCGEGSSLQYQRSGIGHLGQINKIFISHLHGDHVFGLTAMLCMLGAAAVDKKGALAPVVDIYGPEGIRDYIRASTQLTHSHIVVGHRIHELKNLPSPSSSATASVTTSRHHRYDEIVGSNGGDEEFDHYPDDDGIYSLCQDERDDGGGISVKAASMEHRIPCVGFVVTEASRPGPLNVKYVQPLLEKHKEELVAQHKVPVLELMKKIKELEPGQVFHLPDGSVITAEDAIKGRIPGRKVVIMGDTRSGKHIRAIADQADVLVHEATLAYLPGVECLNKRKYAAGARAVEAEVKRHGHSTPQMAGEFAQQIGAKRLILTHFSPRFSGESDEEKMQVMWAIEDLARSTAGPNFMEANDVVAAWDMMKLKIPPHAPSQVPKET